MQGNLVAFSWVNASSKVNLISLNIAIKKNQIIKKGRGVEHGLIRITHVPHFTNCSNVGIKAKGKTYSKKNCRAKERRFVEPVLKKIEE